MIDRANRVNKVNRINRVWSQCVMNKILSKFSTDKNTWYMDAWSKCLVKEIGIITKKRL